jgi:hypothetical protein
VRNTRRKSNTIPDIPLSFDSGTSGMVPENLRAQVVSQLPAPYLEAGGLFGILPRACISAEEFQLYHYLSIVPPAFTLL